MTQKINLCREYGRVFCGPSQLRPRLLAVMKTPETISLRRSEVLRRSTQNLVMELRRRSLTSAITQEKSQKKTVSSIKKGSIISVVGKTTVEIIELFECTQKVP